MKTKLPTAVSTVDEAKVFLKELHDNGESFHPEDDATDIAWDTGLEHNPTTDECRQLNKLMEDIYNLPGNDGRHCGEMVFDPCEFLLDLNPAYIMMTAEDRISEIDKILSEKRYKPLENYQVLNNERNMLLERISEFQKS